MFVTRLRVLGEMLVGALERQKMFAGLREAEERVSLAADSAEAGLWTLDYRTGVFWVTERAGRSSGMRPTRSSTWSVSRRRSIPTTGTSFGDAIERSARTGEPIDVEYRIVATSERQRALDRVPRAAAA